MNAPRSAFWPTLAALFGPAQRTPLRVGVLNTGELVLVDGADRAQVLSAQATQLIRQAMIDTDPVMSELVLMPRAAVEAEAGGAP